MLKLKKHSQYQVVYKKGRSFKKGNLALCLFKNGLNQNRIGITVTTRSVHLSVKRNRCKRLIREAYKKTEKGLRRGYDMVFIAKKDISKETLFSISDNISELYKRSGILF